MKCQTENTRSQQVGHPNLHLDADPEDGEGVSVHVPVEVEQDKWNEPLHLVRDEVAESAHLGQLIQGGF